MNTAAPIQTRLVLLLGIVAALGLAAFMVMRGGIIGSSDDTAAPVLPVKATPGVPAKATVTPTGTPAPKAAKPKPAIVLNPGLPAALAKALRREPVVVAALYAPHAGDAAAVRQARAGAADVHAGFVALNVYDERTARELEPLVGPISDPSVLIFTRPGTVTQRLDGFADSVTVAQAAHDAGAR